MQHAGPRPVNPPAQSLSSIAEFLGVEPPPAVADVVVNGVTLNSRAVRPGDLYAALPGLRAHGADFAPAAFAAGAVAVLADPTGADRIEAAWAASGHSGPAPVLVVDNPRSRLGEVSAMVYGYPARDLTVIGVTGTNGKTTTAYLIEACLLAAGRRPGLIGTVETRIGEERLPGVRTTPEAPDLQAIFAVLRERGADSVVMEVSSHALAQGRVDGIVFDVAAFTNLSQDHLDFHDGMEDYFAAKASLFTPLRSRRGLVVITDEYGRRLAATAGVPVSTVAPQVDPELASADWSAAEVELTPTGTSFRAQSAGFDCPLRIVLPGDFNVANALLATAVADAVGLDCASIQAGLAQASVPGRMQQVVAGQPFAVVVDYAHTPDAVATALAALRNSTAGRLIAVLGCGGDRDADKRPLMGEAAARIADVVVVTDDNPRSEHAEAIRRAILLGTEHVPEHNRAEVVEVADRQRAIATAIGLAEAGDGVAILGKGHETGQEVAGKIWPFDDREAARAELAASSQLQSPTDVMTG